uniref:Uncharacterized protein n=1 Tax=Rangifer tarandus platyrhynchus TaxID=3082113 RepID=A0ACB0EZB4_RANTA|nr:unnamed protein product [Rangifer tarandus platyrhynchus]
MHGTLTASQRSQPAPKQISNASTALPWRLADSRDVLVSEDSLGWRSLQAAPRWKSQGRPHLKASRWQQDGLLQDVMQSSVREGAGSSSLKTSLQALTLSSEDGAQSSCGWDCKGNVFTTDSSGSFGPAIRPASQCEDCVGQESLPEGTLSVGRSHRQGQDKPQTRQILLLTLV